MPIKRLNKDNNELTIDSKSVVTDKDLYATDVQHTDESVMLNFAAVPTLLVEDTNQCNKDTWASYNGTAPIPDITNITSDHLLNVKKKYFRQIWQISTPSAQIQKSLIT
jgi:hypothetical protein